MAEVLSRQRLFTPLS